MRQQPAERQREDDRRYEQRLDDRQPAAVERARLEHVANQQSVGPLLAPGTSMLLAWAGQPITEDALAAFTTPGSQRLVLRFNSVERGAVLEAA